MRQTFIFEGGSEYLLLDEDLDRNRGALLEIKWPFLRRPREGEVRVIEGDLYHCTITHYLAPTLKRVPLWKLLKKRTDGTSVSDGTE